MVEVLAFEFYDLLLVLYLDLADCTDLFIFFVMVDRIAPLVDFVEWYLFIVFLDFVEHPCVLLEPFLSCMATHYVHRCQCSHSRGARNKRTFSIQYRCSHLRLHA